MAPEYMVLGLKRAVRDGSSVWAAGEAVAAWTSFHLSTRSSAYCQYRGHLRHLHGNALLKDRARRHPREDYAGLLF